MPNPEVWSDSEDGEELDEIETDVLLGLPDGPVDSIADLVDPAVSRAGGCPAFLPSVNVPLISMSECHNCKSNMELLVQVWCPMEGSPMDRVLYVWGCSRRSCQKKEGSIRAYRNLKFNERFAAKLKKEADNKKKDPPAKSPVVSNTANPFSTGPPMVGSGTSLFGTGNLFSQPASTPTSKLLESTNVTAKEEPEEEADEPPVTKDELDQLVKEFESSSIDSRSENAAWTATPAFLPIYLSSASEYLVRGAIPEAPKTTTEMLASGEDKGGAWSETYERSSTDGVFERFVRRVSSEGSQCFRYELSGTPLPYQNDQIYQQLFPLSRDSQDRSVNRLYSASSLPPCPVCKSSRIFECQLMPNLISCLKRRAEKCKSPQSDEDRRREVSRLLSDSADAAGDTAGMEWGTCMVFSCSDDCRVDPTAPGVELKECWREELVLVQWE